ncbi:MAG: beta-N-acetylhexosaminidase [Candidatus Aminicenantaceae bacterium]
MKPGFIWFILALAVFCFVCIALPFPADQSPPKSHNLMPVPLQMGIGEGFLSIEPGFSVSGEGYWEPRLTRAVERMIAQLSLRTGLPLDQMQKLMPEQPVLTLLCEGPGETVQSPWSDESYALDISEQWASLRAPNPLGILHGLETFLQLVEPGPEAFQVPVVRIQDRPRFPWRGLLIDACRHWIPPDVIKRNLDGMAAVKLNVLHWHLSEDQGFRVESRRFPRLHELGSDGLYYTQDQIREIIVYARDRGIRVVPEFDMPGHTTAWFVGYPELASRPGPYSIKRHWGVMDACIDPSREETYDFLDRFIEEMAGLFPDAYFHIGGDEVNGKHWDASPEITAFKRTHGMQDNHDLQAYFNRRILSSLTKYGKKMVGWDEIFHPDLPKDAVVQSWRGQESLAKTSREGYLGILSNGYYLDFILSAGYHYGVDPLAEQADSLTDEERGRILGGEACMWSEFVNPETIDSRIWPRLAAIAERFWSPRDASSDVKDMYRRLQVTSQRLEWLGLRHSSNYLPMLRRLTGNRPIDRLKVLADLVEPVKFYTRPGTREYTQQTPFNRLVDAARPESLVSQDFRDRVDAWQYNASARSENRGYLRESLNLWRINHDLLLPQLKTTFLLEELIPLSQEVSELARIGLHVLDLYDVEGEASEAWLREIAPSLDRPRRPQYEVVVPIAPAIGIMVETTFQERGGDMYSDLDLLEVDAFHDQQPTGWDLQIPENWEVREANGDGALHLLAPGPPGEVRAPTSWALLRNHDVTSFVMTGQLRCLAETDNPNRDLVVIFHFQDPTHFYYVHFSASSDGLHNIIGLVNGSDRVKINLEPAGESTARLIDREYHDFKVWYDADSGEIRAYLDDMQSPILNARDTTLGHGRAGIGSFDDTGSFDNIILWGKSKEEDEDEGS